MLSAEVRREREARIKSEREERLKASSTRKREMQELEMRRKQNEKPSDFEQVPHRLFITSPWHAYKSGVNRINETLHMNQKITS